MKDVEEEDCQKSLRTGSTYGGTVLPSRCIFCVMMCCAELRVDERIQQIATVKHDSKIISITSDELFAEEAKYHCPRYKDYTHPEKQLAGNNYPIKADISKTSQEIAREI